MVVTTPSAGAVITSVRRDSCSVSCWSSIEISRSMAARVVAAFGRMRGELGLERCDLALLCAAAAFQRLQPGLLVQHLLALLAELHLGDELLAHQLLMALEGLAAARQPLGLRGDRPLQLRELGCHAAQACAEFLVRQVRQRCLLPDLAREARAAFAQLLDRSGLRFARVERRSLGRQHEQGVALLDVPAFLDALFDERARLRRMDLDQSVGRDQVARYVRLARVVGNAAEHARPRTRPPRPGR